MKTSEHYNKYEALAQKIGIDKLLPLIQDITEEDIKSSYSRDKNLNNIALCNWDRMAGKKNQSQQDCSMYFNVQYSCFCNLTLSLAERVCLLKHVAKYHKAKIQPELE